MTTIRHTLLSRTSYAKQALSQIQLDLERAERVATSGLKATRPSDFPSGWQEVHNLRAAIADQEVYQDNAVRTDTYLQTAETALASAADLLKSAWEMGVQAASETLGGDERQAIGEVVANVREQLISQANTRLGDRYLFSGQAYEGEAFDATGTYQGSNDLPEVLVGPDRWIQAGFDGSEVFQGGVDVFQVLDDLATAMAADDPDAVQNLLDDAEAAVGQVVESRQRLGYLTDQVEDALAVAENANEVFNERLDQAIGADPIEAYTDLANLQTAYEGALQVTASTLSGAKLFDFLR